MADYSLPHVIPPLSLHSHTHTIILLHGTSSTGPDFANALLSHQFSFHSSTETDKPSENTTLPSLLPSVKWVFPTGKLRKVKVLGGVQKNAWFNFHSFTDRTVGELENVEGLRESTAFLTEVIKQEVESLEEAYGKGQGGKRVIFGGFSQGAAMTAILLLGRELEQKGIEVGGWACLSGWLPFRAQLEALLSSPYLGGPVQNQKLVATNYVRELLSLKLLELQEGGLNKKDLEKVYISHGFQDVKMLPEWGEKLGNVLDEVGYRVTWEEYDVAHWWCEESLNGLVRWITSIWSDDNLGARSI